MVLGNLTQKRWKGLSQEQEYLEQAFLGAWQRLQIEELSPVLSE
ncbi:hypothetical protein [Calothrix sp. UHCC 0171]|nr:hypothetical protein [Calothrix sp. UHCC 0171]MEA5573490.1 hypothetical protein [Calothrix sp. UHCC 0171]